MDGTASQMGHSLRLLIVVGLLIGLVATPLSAHAAQPTTPAGVGRYIVAFDDSAPLADIIDALVVGRGGTVLHRYESVFNGFAAELPEAALQGLSRHPLITAIMPDPEVTVSAQTVPAGITRTRATSNTTAKIDGIDERVNVDVAVLDTGVGPHGDLNIVGGKDCTGTGSYNDDHGHGTHVAGTIGALDNTTGVVGMAPGARIWSVKVLGANGSGYGSWILCGIDWVTANAGTIEVANMSLGGSTSYRDDGNCGYTNGDAIHRAICKSVGAGVTYIVAAGNDAKDAVGYFPAQYDEVITTSALTTSDALASFSNYGPDVDVIAPGVSVTSTAKGGGYTTMSGTSMASPHAAGAAALYTVANSGASPAAVRSALIATGSTSAWSGDKDSTKESLIDVSTFGATPATNDAQVASVSAPPTVTQGTAATVTVAVKNNGSTSETIAVVLSESPGGFSQTQSVTVGAGASVNVPFTWLTTVSTATGTHTFTATATVANDSNITNNTGTATTTVETAVSTATMSVSDMTLTSTAVSGGYQLSSTVTVQSSGTAISGASVTIEYTDPNGAKTSQTASTNTAGVASFSRTVTATGTYSVAVMTVTKTGVNYDASKNTVSSKSVTIQTATTSSALYVSSMSLTSSTLSSGYRLNTRVYIQSNGVKVSGASVTVQYTDPNGAKVSATATTNTYGYAAFARSVTTSGTYSVAVTNVTKSGSSYDASKNAVTSKTITVGSTSTGGAMSVSNITLSSSAVSGGTKLTTNVYVVSGTTKISGASVTLKYTDPNGSTTSQTATTNTSGYATFTRTVAASGTYTVAVTGVTKSGSTYDASKNVVTSKSITVGSTSTGSEASCLSSEEAAFLKLINDYRASKGLKPLTATKSLNTAAYKHSLDMGQKNFFSHTGSDGSSFTTRMSREGYTYSTYKGENIAAGHPTAQKVFDAWKASSGHNANMLNANYKAVGIGFVQVSGSKYTYYWTTDFGGYVDATATCS